MKRSPTAPCAPEHGFACGYPGTPSTEIIEAAARMEGIHSEWCVNEKVALETAAGRLARPARAHRHHEARGAQRGRGPVHDGCRYTGVNAGARGGERRRSRHGIVAERAGQPQLREFAKVPMLEPSDSQEAYDFIADAFALSEEFDTPVMLRTTTRDLAWPRAGAAARAGGGGAARLRAGHQQVRHGPAVRAAAEPARPRAPREAAQARRGEPAERARGGLLRLRHHRLGRRLCLRPRGVPQGLVPQAGHVAPAAVRQGRAPLRARLARRGRRGARPVLRGPGARPRPSR